MASADDCLREVCFTAHIKDTKRLCQLAAKSLYVKVELAGFSANNVTADKAGYGAMRSKTASLKPTRLIAS